MNSIRSSIVTDLAASERSASVGVAANIKSVGKITRASIALDLKSASAIYPTAIQSSRICSG